jgi:ubiquinone/menaquinone biosynthesis C-methylase UbiE
MPQKQDNPHSMNLPELEAYWQGVHRELGARLPAEALLVEANPRPIRWLNHTGHAMGMRFLLRRAGDLRGRNVLDLGCGRGRWSALFAAGGTRVTGVDWSADALVQAKRAAPEANFRRMSITALDFPEASFDLVNSVTVIQHLPLQEHEKVFREAARVLVPGGHLLIIEIIVAQPGAHVFPRSAEEWTKLAERCGFTVMASRGCNYELLLRPYQRVVRAFSARLVAEPPALPGVGGARPSFHQRLNRAMLSALGLVSIPLEWACRPLPRSLATHGAFLFRKV